ncbi:MAG: DUF1045 domain-containing protein [Rhizobiaceae bacterium]|jgi:hypothetical protein|nr:DUF1045 domain-containing protein [Rhizobiaceae bacterium]
MPRPAIESPARYAIYLAPPAASPLWRFGSAVLGYDAETGEDMLGFHPAAMHEAAWRAATARARAYGFHATLKAPFRLAPNRHEVELVEALEDFAQTVDPLAQIRLNLAVLDESGAGGFLALIPETRSEALSALERETVSRLDAFRAPLSDAEIAKRNPAQLTPRQRLHLAEFGYPFVFEDFQPHFTLSDRLPEPHGVALDIGARLASEVGRPQIIVDQLALFRQATPDERFRVFARVPLRGARIAPVPHAEPVGDMED